MKGVERTRLPVVVQPNKERKIFVHDFIGQPVLVASTVDKDKTRYEKDNLYKYTNVGKLIKEGERLEAACNPEDEEEEPAMVDGQPILSEIGAGQMIGAWLRRIKYCLVPGNPDRLFMPFHDLIKEGERLEAACNPEDEEEEPAMVDGQPILSEIGAGQMIGAWLRRIKYCLVPGNPDRLFMPFHDFFAVDVVEDEILMDRDGSGSENEEEKVERVEKVAPKTANRRETFTTPAANDKTMVTGSTNAMHNKYAIVVNCRKALIVDEDENFCKLVANQMENALTIVRQREDRVRHQKKSLRKLRLACKNWRGLSSSRDLLEVSERRRAKAQTLTKLFIYYSFGSARSSL